MRKKLPLVSALSLSPAERIVLVEDIWDSIASVPEAIELTEKQRAELDARLEAYRKDRTAGSAWEVVKARIRGANEPRHHRPARGGLAVFHLSRNPAHWKRRS
jgi:putative addiction module component (TIGR02574 family)